MQLEAAGYSTVLQVWDVRPSDLLHEMQQATTSASWKPSSGLSVTVTDPGPACRRPGHHAGGAPAALTTDMPTTVARVLQEKP